MRICNCALPAMFGSQVCNNCGNKAEYVSTTSLQNVSCENASEITRKSNANQWIPCESITEPIDREVLCCDKNGNELIGWLGYNDYDECWVCESDECVMYDTVAYMEKPKPYEGRIE